MPATNGNYSISNFIKVIVCINLYEIAVKVGLKDFIIKMGFGHYLKIITYVGSGTYIKTDDIYELFFYLFKFR